MINKKEPLEHCRQIHTVCSLRAGVISYFLPLSNPNDEQTTKNAIFVDLLNK